MPSAIKQGTPLSNQTNKNPEPAATKAEAKSHTAPLDALSTHPSNALAQPLSSTPLDAAFRSRPKGHTRSQGISLRNQPTDTKTHMRMAVLVENADAHSTNDNFALVGDKKGRGPRQVENKKFGKNKENIEHWPLREDWRNYFDKAFSIEKKDFDNLVGDWRQGAEGNCTTVAVAKAAMDVYGKNVFAEVEVTKTGLKVKKHDGKTVELTAKELHWAAQESNFRGDNKKALAYADIIYAVTAKSAQDTRHQGARTFSRAMHNLNDGQWIPAIAKLLGLEKKLIKVDAKTLKGAPDASLGSSYAHTVYVDTDRGDKPITDSYGDPKNYNRTDTWGNRLKWVYTLEALPEESSPIETMPVNDIPEMDSENDMAA
jgi:hypothetical protein